MPKHDPVPEKASRSPRMTSFNMAKLQIVGGPRFSILDVSSPVPVVIVPPDAMDPRYWNLFRATSIVHAALEVQCNTIQALVEMAEQTGLDMIVAPLIEAVTAGNLARMIADKGVEHVTRDERKR